jgi:hypothetical protein
MPVINADGCPTYVEVEGQAARASRRPPSTRARMIRTMIAAMVTARTRPLICSARDLRTAHRL